jgi:hypothetical protein
MMRGYDSSFDGFRYVARRQVKPFVEFQATEFDEDVFTLDSRAPNPEEVVLQNDSGTLM